MNKCILTGRLVKNPELKTINEKSKCEFVIAVNRPVIRDGQREADFLACEAWGKTAENLVKYQTKGSLIAVIGSVRKITYEREDGTRAYYDFILANEIEYLSGVNKEIDKQEIKEQVDAFEEFGASIDEESLPF